MLSLTALIIVATMLVRYKLTPSTCQLGVSGKICSVGDLLTGWARVRYWTLFGRSVHTNGPPVDEKLSVGNAETYTTTHIHSHVMKEGASE
jgi:hypothetical protein